MDAIYREIEQQKDYLDEEIVKTIYLGGGTNFRGGLVYDLVYKWNNKYSVNLGVSTELEKFETSEKVDVSFFTTNARLGLSYFF